jgi:nucleotide-binding universal stress UspA family protein
MHRTILVPLDGSSFSERALSVATALARATGGKLVLVRAASASVLPGAHSSDLQDRQIQKEDLFISADAGGAGRGEAQIRAIEEAERYLQGIAGGLAEQGFQAKVAVPYAAAAEGILTEIAVQAADLVIMCTHGQSGLGRWIYGSVAEKVLAHSTVPVLLVRPTGAPVTLSPEPDGFRLLVPLDGSAFAEAALPHATALARAFGGSILLVYVVGPPYVPYTEMMAAPAGAAEIADMIVDEEQEKAERYLTDAGEHLRRDGLPVQTAVCKGAPADTILQQALVVNARLIVMATHGRTGLRRLLLGSVAHEVVHRALLPVLLVRPADPAKA